MRILVTGGMGCIGAWTLYHLVKQGKEAVSFDLSTDCHRLDLLLTPDEQAAITFITGDLSDTEQVQRVFSDQGITHVIHLAALQVPACRANPALGAKVNVLGTVNIFEAARNSGIRHIAYASSIAVYGPAEAYSTPILPHDAPKLPRTVYGVYKAANESLAEVYWRDYGLSSTGLRPYTVFGLGRDQGLTSEPTKAMEAAARGESFHISFNGRMQFHYASDVAQQFIAAAEIISDGANCFNLGTEPVEVQTVADLIMKLVPGVNITVGNTRLPFPHGFEDSELRRAFRVVYETPLPQAIAATIEGFRQKYLNSGFPK